MSCDQAIGKASGVVDHVEHVEQVQMFKMCNRSMSSGAVHVVVSEMMLLEVVAAVDPIHTEKYN